MSGRDHFRKCWSQQPIYSGGPVASIVPEAADGGPPLMVMAFGCTVNVVRADTGEAVASIDSPLDEDIIIHVAGTGAYNPDGTVTAGPSTANDTNGEANDHDNDVAATSTAVPCGTAAFSTESRQIFALGVWLDTMTGAYELKVIKTWTAAQHAIACLRFSPTGTHLASGATDGGLKVWDVHHHYVTHNYRGRGGIVTFVAFSDDGELMAAGTVEGYISIMDFTTKEVVIASRAYQSPVEAGAFFADGSLVTVGRDRRVAVFAPRTLTERKAVVLRDHVACAVFAGAENLFVGTPDGVVTQCVVSAETGSVAVRSRTAPVPNATENEDAIRSLALLPQAVLDGGVAAPTTAAKRHRREGAAGDEEEADAASIPLVVAADASQRLHYLRPLQPADPANPVGISKVKTIVGYLDQIFDVRLLPAEQPSSSGAQPSPGQKRSTAIDEADGDEQDDAAADVPEPTFARAVASNSKNVAIFRTRGSEQSAVLAGHSDLVTGLDVSADGRFIATASKDESVRLWRLSDCSCVGVGLGHDGAVGAVAMNPKMATASVFVLISVGSDECIKVWDARRPSTKVGGRDAWAPLQTVVNAHSGPVHCVAIAPNDSHVATGGKDKLVQLWTLSAKGLVKVGAFAGHRRTVNAVEFAPADRLLISASSDGAVKVWSLASMVCARTLQHDKVGITQARFFNGGRQIVTSNAQGILRMWAIAASEVVASIEAHGDRVWSVAVDESRPGSTYFVTGAADATVAAFEDYTAEEAERLKQDKHDFLLLSQKLQNAIRRGDWASAVALALRLKHPRHLREVLTRWTAADETGCEDGMTDIIATSNEGDLSKLLEFARMWIANARHAPAAAIVLAALLRAFHFADLRAMPAVKETIEALAGYNKRHEARAVQVLEQLHYVDYLTRSLRPVGAANALVQPKSPQ